MLSSALYLVAYIAFLFLSILNRRGYRLKNFNSSYAVLAFILVFVITFRGNWLPDYIPYADSFYKGNSRMEITWSLFRNLTYWTGSHLSIFFIYALLAVAITLIGIVKSSKTILLSILVWMSYIFIVQDMIQIRQGVASAIFFYSIQYIAKHNWKRYMLLNALGALFHVSAITTIPLYFLGKKNLQRGFYLWLIPVSYLLYFANLGIVYLIQYIPIDFIQSLWITKSQTLFVTENVNLFNLRQLIMVAIISFIWLNIKKINRYYPESIIYIKIFTIAAAVFILLFDVPDIASRTNIVYSMSEIIAIPSIIYAFKHTYYGKVIVLCTAVIFFSTYFLRFVIP